MRVHISQCRFCAIDSSAECRYLSEISSVSNVWQSHLFCDRPKNETKRIQLPPWRSVLCNPLEPTGMIVQIVVFIYRLCYHFPCCLPTFLLTVLAKSNIAENTDADMTISAPSLSTFGQRLIPFLPRPRFLTLSLIPVKLFPSSSGSRSDFITWATIKLHDWPTASMRQSLLRKAVVSALNLLTSLCSASWDRRTDRHTDGRRTVTKTTMRAVPISDIKKWPIGCTAKLYDTIGNAILTCAQKLI